MTIYIRWPTPNTGVFPNPFVQVSNDGNNSFTLYTPDSLITTDNTPTSYFSFDPSSYANMSMIFSGEVIAKKKSGGGLGAVGDSKTWVFDTRVKIINGAAIVDTYVPESQSDDNMSDCHTDLLAVSTGNAEITQVTCVADSSLALHEQVQTHPVADSGGSLAGHWFKLFGLHNVTNYALWFKVSGSGSAPSAPGFTLIEIDIATNDTAATIGAAIVTALSGNPDVTASYTNYAGSNILTFNWVTAGTTNGFSDVNVGFTGTVVTQTGTDATHPLAGTYFKFYSALDQASYVPWFKVSGSGSAPSVSGTLIEVDISSNDSANTVAAALNTALQGFSTFTSGVSTNVVTITNSSGGVATDASDIGATGFGIVVTQQGTNVFNIVYQVTGITSDTIEWTGVFQLAVND